MGTQNENTKLCSSINTMASDDNPPNSLTAIASTLKRRSELFAIIRDIQGFDFTDNDLNQVVDAMLIIVPGASNFQDEICAVLSHCTMTREKHGLVFEEHVFWLIVSDLITQAQGKTFTPLPVEPIVRVFVIAAQRAISKTGFIHVNPDNSSVLQAVYHWMGQKHDGPSHATVDCYGTTPSGRIVSVREEVTALRKTILGLQEKLVNAETEITEAKSEACCTAIKLRLELDENKRELEILSDNNARLAGGLNATITMANKLVSIVIERYYVANEMNIRRGGPLFPVIETYMRFMGSGIVDAESADKDLRESIVNSLGSVHAQIGSQEWESEFYRPGSRLGHVWNFIQDQVLDSVEQMDTTEEN